MITFTPLNNPVTLSAPSHSQIISARSQTRRCAFTRDNATKDLHEGQFFCTISVHFTWKDKTKSSAVLDCCLCGEMLQAQSLISRRTLVLRFCAQKYSVYSASSCDPMAFIRKKQYLLKTAHTHCIVSFNSVCISLVLVLTVMRVCIEIQRAQHHFYRDGSDQSFGWALSAPPSVLTKSWVDVEFELAAGSCLHSFRWHQRKKKHQSIRDICTSL